MINVAYCIIIYYYIISIPIVHSGLRPIADLWEGGQTPLPVGHIWVHSYRSNGLPSKYRAYHLGYWVGLLHEQGC